jgi:hypothetical protein
MVPKYVVVMLLCITLLPDDETALRAGRYYNIVVFIMTRVRESSKTKKGVYARRRRNKTLKLREEHDSRRRGRLFGSLATY